MERNYREPRVWEGIDTKELHFMTQQLQEQQVSLKIFGKSRDTGKDAHWWSLEKYKSKPL